MEQINIGNFFPTLPPYTEKVRPEDKPYLLLFALVSGIGKKRIEKLLSFGKEHQLSGQELWEQSTKILAELKFSAAVRLATSEVKKKFTAQSYQEFLDQRKIQTTFL